jgi:hypothetical protein
MQNSVSPKVITQVFAHSHHPLKLSTVNHINISKSALRPIYSNRSPAKRRLMTLGPSMDLIAFRHRSNPPFEAKQMMATALVNTRTTVATPYLFLRN